MFASIILAGILIVKVLNAGAQSTTLFIPGFSGDGPLSISELGVGEDGQTTWAVVSGAAQGTEIPKLPGTATLIEDSDGLFLTYNLGNIGGNYVSCAISDGDAACQGAFTEAGSTSYLTRTIPAQPTLVALSGASYSASASLAATSSSPSSGSSASHGPSQTSSTGAAPPASTTHANGASHMKRTSAGVVAAAASAGYLLWL
ncbi:hypothetical protein OE88DRAFT_1667250 [Heliocybe sulcata]|uniref:Uncharacterized protein n=1 Tax=Heliocybe sulcata TaxID=5364 RepID=A0A5C3MMY2_9AGAM|nr:hypothetical protein OE88DRAFT_1667250 [Heliocybe sulcata]